MCPRFLFFKDGKRVTDLSGAKTGPLRSLIETHL